MGETKDPGLGNSHQSVDKATQAQNMPIEEAKPDQTRSGHFINSTVEKLDIEHAIVQDDPRKWSKGRKIFTLAIVSCSSLLLTLSVNIYNPAINNIKHDLHATYKELSWTLSIYALVQGFTPLMWGVFTELYGRKLVYLVSISLFIVGSGVAGASKSVQTLIVMRIIQGTGGSAVLTIGAATLADIYDPQERGTVMGIYYATPLLGSSLGPVIGGAATRLFSWRATFYFLVILGGLALLSFVFFKDTFRKERSLAYQSALREVIRKRNARVSENEETVKESHNNVEAQPIAKDIQLRLKDVHILRPLVLVLKRINNICILIVSGTIFGGITYCLSYTTVLTFGAAPYKYGPLRVGLVLLSLGIGSVIGSILGGKWSDRTLRKCRLKNNGVTTSEDRLKSTIFIMAILPISLVAYAWLTEKKVHIAPICVALFFIGLSSVWIYASILAYIVDANAGRSSSAVAVNSLFRGIGAFVATEVAVPLHDALGDGGLYTLVAGLMGFMVCGLILLLIVKGAQWRKKAEGMEEEEEEEKEDQDLQSENK